MMMEIYEPSMINIMNNYEESPKICSKLALCSKNEYLMLVDKHRERRDIIEGNKDCTWGISYLCSSKEATKKCDVIFSNIFTF